MKKNDLETLDEFLIGVANAKVGIRRKMLRIQQFLNILKKKSNEKRNLT